MNKHDESRATPQSDDGLDDVPYELDDDVCQTCGGDGGDAEAC